MNNSFQLYFIFLFIIIVPFIGSSVIPFLQSKDAIKYKVKNKLFNLNRNKAIILVLLTGIIWSTGGFMVKLISWPPLVISGIRSILILIMSYKLKVTT